MRFEAILTKKVYVWCTSDPLRIVVRIALIACLSPVISAKATLPSSALPNLGPFGNLAELENQTGMPDTMNGGLGVFTPWQLVFTTPTKTEINGEFYTTDDAQSSKTVVVDGTVFSGPAIAFEQSQLSVDSSALAALTPDQTFGGDQTEAMNFDVGPGQVEVVDLNGGLNLDNQKITLTGGGDLVLNIQGSFGLAGTAGILGDPDNIDINYEGDSPITTGTSATIDGLIFDPNAAANLDGTWSGGVYAGTKTITLMVETDPSPAPEPGSMVLISTGLVSLLLAHRRLCSMKIQFKEKETT